MDFWKTVCNKIQISRSVLILGHTLLHKLYINAVIAPIYLSISALKNLHRLRYKQFAENMYEKTVIFSQNQKGFGCIGAAVFLILSLTIGRLFISRMIDWLKFYSSSRLYRSHLSPVKPRRTIKLQPMFLILSPKELI